MKRNDDQWRESEELENRYLDIEQRETKIMAEKELGMGGGYRCNAYVEERDHGGHCRRIESADCVVDGS
jgi:hypothetical protein